MRRIGGFDRNGWGLDMMRRVVSIAACAALVGCGSSSSSLPPDTYAVPVEIAYERLIAGDMIDFRTGSQCGILIHFNAEKELNKQVRWLVTSSGTQVAQFTVRLIPVDAQTTRFEIDVPADPEGGEIYDGTKVYARPALHQPLRPAVQALIAARMEQRPFDATGLPRSEVDSVCSVQRAGLESGSAQWGVNDRPGMDSRQTARADSWDRRYGSGESGSSEPAMGKPMSDAEPTW